MSQYPKTSTKTLIHPFQTLPMLKLLVVNLKWNQSDFNTHTTTSILWTIPIMKLTLLMRMKNTLKKIMRKNNSLKMWMKTQSLKKNYKMFIHILTTTYHQEQWILISCLSTTMTKTTSFTTHNSFASIIDDSYVNVRPKQFKQVPSRLEMRN